MYKKDKKEKAIRIEHSYDSCIKSCGSSGVDGVLRPTLPKPEQGSKAGVRKSNNSPIENAYQEQSQEVLFALFYHYSFSQRTFY